MSDEQLDKASNQVFAALERHSSKHNWEDFTPQEWGKMRWWLWSTISLISNEMNVRLGWEVQDY